MAKKRAPGCYMNIMAYITPPPTKPPPNFSVTVAAPKPSSRRPVIEKDKSSVKGGGVARRQRVRRVDRRAQKAVVPEAEASDPHRRVRRHGRRHRRAGRFQEWRRERERDVHVQCVHPPRAFPWRGGDGMRSLEGTSQRTINCQCRFVFVPRLAASASGARRNHRAPSFRAS